MRCVREKERDPGRESESERGRGFLYFEEDQTPRAAAKSERERVLY